MLPQNSRTNRQRFIVFETSEARNAALNANEPFFLHGRLLRTGEPHLDRRRPQPDRALRPSRSPAAPTRTLYVGNLAFNISDQELSDLFRDLPGMSQVRIAIDRGTGWPMGYAHVDFKSVEDAQAARDALEGRVVTGRAIKVDFANEKRPRGSRSDAPPPSQSGEQSDSN